MHLFLFLSRNVLFFAAVLLPLVLLSYPLPLRAQKAPGLVITPDLQFNYALELFENKDFTAAQVEFKRFIHFFPDDSRRDAAEFKTAMALFNSGSYYDAAKAFNTIILDHKDETPYTQEAYFMQSRAFKAMNNAGYAAIVLQNYLKLTGDPEIRDRLYFELAQLHISQARKPGKETLNDAKKYLTLISPARSATYQVPARLSALEAVNAAPKKDPTLSGLLALIPGGGFLYCERYKDAFVTFCLNAGLIWGAYEAFDSGNPGLGGVISFVASGFYAGNIYGAISAAHKENTLRQIRILERHFSMDASLDPAHHAMALTFNHPF